MKQFITRRSFIKAAGAATALTAVSVGAPAAFAEETNCFFGDKADVTILYTNDVHTYIDNKSPKPTYAAIAALKKSIEDTGRDVLLVDAGDHIQGTAYGSMDDGATIIELMNEAGYDLATPGNHEFDYGIDPAFHCYRRLCFRCQCNIWRLEYRCGPIILVTNTSLNPIARYADIVIDTNSVNSGCGILPLMFIAEALTAELARRLGPDSMKILEELESELDKADVFMR